MSLWQQWCWRFRGLYLAILILDGGSNVSVLLPEQSKNLSVPVSFTGTQPGGSLLVTFSSKVSDQMAGVQALVTFVPGQ
jgi:hypothetical protein